MVKRGPVFKMEKRVGDYDVKRKLGEGTYGHVFIAKHRTQNLTVAIKRLMAGLVSESEQEAAMLNLCAHPNVIRLLELIVNKKASKATLVFEYMPSNLDEKLHQIPRAEIKPIMQQLLSALAHCHSLGVLHADVKPDNILVDKKYKIKLADFGIATNLYEDSPEPHSMYSPMYRAPELLLGSRSFTVAADMWAAGCVFADLLLQNTLFKSGKEDENLEYMCQLCGVPTEETWPGVSRLPEFSRLSKVAVNEEGPRLRDVLLGRLGQRRCDSRALDLVEKMLVMNPRERITAEEALNHSYFSVCSE